MRNWEECLSVSAALSTTGGDSKWSAFKKITRIPTEPSIRTVKKSPNLLTGSDDKVENNLFKSLLARFSILG